MAVVLAPSYAELYDAMLGSWVKSWELVYQVGEQFVRQEGDGIDYFFKNGTWISGGTLIQEYQYDPDSQTDIELIARRELPPAAGVWKLDLDPFEANQGNIYFNIATATGTIFEDPNAIAWTLGPYIFIDDADKDQLISSTSLDAFDETRIIATWKRRQVSSEEIAELEEATEIDLNGDGMTGKNNNDPTLLQLENNFQDANTRAGTPLYFNLLEHFKHSIDAAFDTIVAFDTNRPVGDDIFYVGLYDSEATAKNHGASVATPITASNFLEYVLAEDYDGTFIHRSVNDFVIQGGGFKTPTTAADQPGGDPVPVTPRATIQNEPGNSNIRGTIAMAKLGGQPNSASNQFYFNLSDNTLLDNDNGGYTVFGKVIGTGMDVVDAMAAVDAYDATTYYGNGALGELPLWELPSDNVIVPENFLAFEDVYAIDGDLKFMEFSARSSDRTKLEVEISEDGFLIINALADFTGREEITVTARSLLGGEALSSSFTVGRGSPLPIRVKDIRSGASGSKPNNLVAFNGGVAFSAEDNYGNQELWWSDGTEEGTQKLREIKTGNLGSAPYNLLVNGDQLFFVADDGDTGQELWVTDGSSEQTRRVADLRSGPASSLPRDLTVFADMVIFTALDGEGIRRLWQTTGEGAQIIHEDLILFSDSEATVFLEELYFIAENPGDAVDGGGRALWKWNGSNPPQKIYDAYPESDDHSTIDHLTVCGDKLFFTSSTYEYNTELYVTDGTAEGTRLVRDINSISGGSNPSSLLAVDGVLYFSADDGEHGRELWKSDGSQSGTSMVANIYKGTVEGTANVDFLTNVNGVIFFAASSLNADGNPIYRELWKHDSATGQTALVKDINPTSSSITFGETFTAVPEEDLLYFVARNKGSNDELWVSDGTASGTQMVSDIFVGDAGSSPSELTVSGDKLFFAAQANTGGRELWMHEIAPLGRAFENGVDHLSATTEAEFRFFVERYAYLSEKDWQIQKESTGNLKATIGDGISISWNTASATMSLNGDLLPVFALDELPLLTSEKVESDVAMILTEFVDDYEEESVFNDFLGVTWMLYDGSLDRSALLKLTDEDGNINSDIAPTIYEIIYVQPEVQLEIDVYQAYYRSGNASLSTYGGYPSLRLDGADEDISSADGEIEVSFGDDGVFADITLPRLIIPTSSTTAQNRLSAAFADPTDSFGMDWAINGFRTDYSLEDLFELDAYITVDIIDLFKNETASELGLYDIGENSWSLEYAVEAALRLFFEETPVIPPDGEQGDPTTPSSIDLDALASIFGNQESIPFYLDAPEDFKNIALDLLEIIDQIIDLDFEQRVDNSETIFDIYINSDSLQANWWHYLYDNYLEVNVDVGSESTADEAKLEIAKILSHVLGVKDITNLTVSERLELTVLWGIEDDYLDQASSIRLTENEPLSGKIEQLGEIDRYNLEIIESGFGFDEDYTSIESFLFLDILDPNADLDISLIDIYGEEVAYSATTESWEYIDLTGIQPGSYTIEIYGYGDSLSEYTVGYMSTIPGSVDQEFASNQPWFQSGVFDLGTLNGKSTIEGQALVGSNFYGFNLEGNTNRAQWRINLEDSQWDSDLDLYLYRADDFLAEVILSSADPGSDEALNLKGLAQGSYVLEVRNFLDTASDYSLIFRTPRQDSSSQADVYDRDDNSNDNFDTATSVLTEDSPYGALSIHAPSDKDFFKFELSKAGHEDSYISISLDQNSGDLDLYLYDSTNKLQGSSESSGLVEVISLSGLAAGVYTAEVRGYGGATGFYELSINVPEAGLLIDDLYEVDGGNDSLASASSLGKISGLAVIDNDLTISKEGNDVDFYQFKLAGNGNWTHYIELIGDSGTADLDIRIYDPDSNQQSPVAASSNWGSIETISLDGLQQDTLYVLEILSYNHEESGYQLTFNTPTGSLREDPYERNNEEDRATNLTLENGRLHWDDLNLSSDADVDWFEIRVPANVSSGSYLRVNSLDNLDNLSVQFKDRDSDEVLYNDESLYSSTELSLGELIQGNYLLKVSGKQSQYSLEVELIESSDNELILPDIYDSDGSSNNSSDSATILRSGSNKLSVEDLTIHNEDDIDWFQFSLPNTGNQSNGLGISFNELEGDLDLEIYSAVDGARGDLIIASSGTSDQEFVSFDGLTSGTYFAKVFSYSGVSSGYTLSLDSRSTSVPADRFESNNTLDQAYNLRTLSGTSRLNGSIHSVDDRDFFRFNTLADTSIAHAVTVSAASDLKLTLYDSDGEEIRSSIGSVTLNGLKANSDYTIGVTNSLDSSGISNYELSFQLPTQTSTSTGGGEVTPSLSDWTLMVYLTASDLDQFAFNDINELEDAVSRFAGGTNVAVYWDQSAAGSVDPFSTGNNSQQAWSTAGKAFIKADTNFSRIATDFIIENSEINTGDPDTLFDFINWAATEAPAEKYGLILWDHGAGIYGSNFDDADNVPEDFLVNPELIQALDLSKVAGVDFDLIAFDACLMAMTEIAYELKDYTDYYVASEEIELGAGYDYTTAFSVFEASIGSVSAKDLARSLVTSFENYYVAPDNIADTLSAINTSKLNQLALDLKAFTAAGSSASEAERGVLSSLRDQAIAYENIFGASYEKNYIDLGNWLSQVSINSLLSQSLRDLARAALVSLQASVEYKTRDSRNSSGLAIYFPATSLSQDPVNDFRIGYGTQFKNFIDDTGWYSFLGTLNGLSSRVTADATSIRTLNLGLDNASAGKALNLGLLSGANNSIPLSSNAISNKLYFAFRFEGSTDATTSLEVFGISPATVSLRTSGSPKVLLSGVNSISLNGLESGEYIVEIDALDSAVTSSPSLQLNLPEVQSQITISNDKAAKALDIGLFGSDRLVPGGLISSGQTAYFRFDTPRFPSARTYGVQLLAGGSSIINAKILTSDGQTTISEASGTGKIDMSYRATGNGESYLLEVSSPSSQQNRTALTTPQVTSFSLVIESDLKEMNQHLLAVGLINKSGEELPSPNHNEIGTAAEFVLLTKLYAISKDQSAAYVESDGFAGSNASGWTVTIGSETFTWNLSGHAGHSTRAGNNLSFTNEELAVMRDVTYAELYTTLKNEGHGAATKKPWLRIVDLINDDGGDLASPQHNDISSASEFLALISLYSIGKELSAAPTLATTAGEGLYTVGVDSYDYGLSATVDGEVFTWNDSVHTGHSTRAGANVNFTDVELASIRKMKPSDIAVSETAFNENITAGSAVGILSSTDANAGDTFTYKLVSGTGDTDNAAFTIDGAQLKINSSPDYETKSSYSIRVRTTDAGGLTFDKVLAFTVNDLTDTPANTAPTDLSITGSAFDENITAGSAVGILSSTDANAGDTFTYKLVSGTGDTDNAAFTIDGAQLKINSSPDYETKSSYSIRVRTTDAGGLTFEKSFSLSVNDLDDRPNNEQKPPQAKDPIISFSNGGSTINASPNQIDEIIFAPSSFKKLTPDIITGFEPGSDKLILSRSIFKKLKKLKLSTLSKKKDLKKASKGLNKSQLVYNKLTGQLIYDENGKKKGLGKGGVFAQFNDDVLPTLTTSDFELG